MPFDLSRFLVIQGDARRIPLRDQAVNCVVTSIPLQPNRPGGRFQKGQHWREKKPFWDEAWLRNEYETKQRSSSEIAAEFDIGRTAIDFWLHRHGIKRRTVKEARKVKKWGVAGKDNPMTGKTGALSPNWKGGATPERQSFYASREWKQASQEARKRDRGICRRCGLKVTRSIHLHHVVSFAQKSMRCVVGNLVSLCKECHHFVHSRANTGKEFLRHEEVRR